MSSTQRILTLLSLGRMRITLAAIILVASASVALVVFMRTTRSGLDAASASPTPASKPNAPADSALASDLKPSLAIHVQQGTGDPTNTVAAGSAYITWKV